MCVCVLIMVYKPYHWGGLGPSWSVAPREIAVNDYTLRYSDNTVAIHAGRFVEMTIVYCIVSRAVPGYGSVCMFEVTVRDFVFVHAY